MTPITSAVAGPDLLVFIMIVKIPSAVIIRGLGQRLITNFRKHAAHLTGLGLPPEHLGPHRCWVEKEKVPAWVLLFLWPKPRAENFVGALLLEKLKHKSGNLKYRKKKRNKKRNKWPKRLDIEINQHL